jgi:hypothetical protein
MTRQSKGLSLGLFVLAVGCSGSSSVSSTGGGAMDAGVDAAARLAEAQVALTPLASAVCEWLFRCCTSSELAVQVGAATASNCADVILQNDASGMLGEYGEGLAFSASAQAVLAQLYSVGSGLSAVSPAALSACVQSVAQASCTPQPGNHCVPSPPPAAGDPCDPYKVLVGAQQLDQPCDPNDFECAPGLACTATDVSGLGGICAPEPAAGALCLTDAACAPSFVCDWSSGTCVAGAAYGAPCSYADPSNPVQGTEKSRCQVGLVCDAVTFKCTDPNCAGGGSCVSDAQCPVGMSCLNSSCGVPAQLGQACTDPGGPCVGGFCSNDTCTSGVCVAGDCYEGPGIGAACMFDTDCQPAAGLVCSAGACNLTPGTVAPCTAANQTCDATSYCSLSSDGSTGACVPKLPAGSLCESYDQCWEGCAVIFGEQRCFGSPPGDGMCHG